MKKFLCLALLFAMLFATSCKADDGKADASAESADASAESADASTAFAEVSGEVSGVISGEVSGEAPSASAEQSDANTVVVPDVKGKTGDEAKALLESAGLSVHMKEKPYDEVPAGEAAETDLDPGDVVEKGTQVWLYVSTGKSLAALSLEYKQSALVESRPVLEQGANSDYEPLNYGFMRACWISQFDTEGVYSYGGLQRDKAEFEENIRRMFAALVNAGINTVIVQLRPNGDSFYPSAYYCPSEYVTGAYTVDFKYDPLAIMVEEAHKAGLSIHGWINPLRCMRQGSVIGINISYGIRRFEQEHMGDYLVNQNGQLYLNPGREEVRQLIIDGAAEIVRYYDVDGVHMDDYFYPTKDPSFDSASFRDQSEYNSLTLYRKGSLNKLVSGIYAAVKAENPKVLFGVSPAGNIDNVRGDFADVDTWLRKEGYVDYIMPQLYYGMKNGRYSYDKLYDTWSLLTKNEKIRMIPGMDLKHAAEGYAGKSSLEWVENKDVLKRCLEYSVDFGNCGGFALFSMKNIIAPVECDPAVPTAEELKNLFDYALKIPSDRIK